MKRNIMYIKLIKTTILLFTLLLLTTSCVKTTTTNTSSEDESNQSSKKNEELEELSIDVKIFEPDSENQRIIIKSNIPLNRETITGKNIKFNEELEQKGIANIIINEDNKTVIIDFRETLENGDYELRISKDIESQNGSNLSKDYAYDFSVDLEQLINGYGELYYEDGSLMFEGNLIEGIPNGTGTLYQEDDTRLTGTFRDGELESCTRYGEDVIAFKEQNNLSIFSTPDIIHKYFFAKFTNLREEGDTPPPEACVSIFSNDKLIYHGDYSNEENTAIGIIYSDDGSPVYFGETKNLLPHGNGSEYTKNGEFITTLYEGHFENGMYNGEGLFYVPESYNSNLLDYYGEWKDNKAHGQGTATYMEASDASKTEKVVSYTFTDGEANGFIITSEQVLVPTNVIHDVDTDINIDIDEGKIVDLAIGLLPQTRAIGAIKKFVELEQKLSEG